MADKRYSVSIEIGRADAIKYSPEFQTHPEFAAKWKAVLQRAHGKAVITCLCPGQGERRLSCHHRSNKDSFHLSRFPKTGSEHGLECMYYSAAHDKSGLGSYTEGVVEETSTGDLKVKLSLSLRKRDEAEEDTPSEPRQPVDSASSKVGKSKPSMGLLGLLHLLWTEAGLNHWTPRMEGKRGLGLVHSVLQGAADKMVASRMRVGDALAIATRSPGQQADENARKVASAIKNKRRMLVIAPLASYKPEHEEARYLTVSGFHGLPRLFIDPVVLQSVQKRFKREISAWRQGRKVIAIAQTDQPEDGNKAKVLNLALMVVSKEWIPVESSYEALIEERLRDQGRRFVKPLRFDSNEEVVFPDFWLMDLPHGKELPMEVYGRSDPKYLARKQEKCDHYETQYGPGGWWAWDASSDPRGAMIPAFPDARSRAVT